MIKYLYIVVLFSALTSCTNKSAGDEKLSTPKSPVQVTSIRIGSIDDNLILSGTTIYLKRNVITSEIPAFITKVNIHLGGKIARGQVLYELQTKESKALGKQIVRADTTLNQIGIIKVYAPSSGIISTFDKQQTGDYVLEGAQLCTIAESNDLAFQINVPYEYSQFTKPGSRCFITLPDNTIHSAILSTPLATMNSLAQTEIVLAKTSDFLFLPENLIIKVQILKPSSGSKQILAKACVLSDEMMKEFWVMKLINDSVAVKVPVTIGNKSDKEIEINSPQFKVDERIIINGNYGLNDTARVKITK